MGEHVLDSGPVRLAELLATRAVSSVELTTEVLARIEDTQPTLNTFRVIRTEAALAEAREADRRLAAGERAPLLGVPLAMKDDQDLAGEPTAFGCFGDFPLAAADCEMVRTLRAAGAVIVGKTNTPELGQWPFTEGPAFGVTRNPWHQGHTPGGSSGGSAAAVAGRVVPVAVGSDGAGSIRIPASWTHLVGIKPERGAIPPGADMFYGISISGPLARRTEDAALVTDVLAGRLPTDDTTWGAARRDPGRLRIGLSFRSALTGYRVRLDPRIRQAVVRLAGVLTGLGHEVVPAEPSYGLIGLNFLPKSTSGLNGWLDRVPDPALLDRRTRKNMANGRRVARYLVGFAKATEGRYERQVGRVFHDVDVLLMPTTATPPPPVGSWANLPDRELNRIMVSACPYAWPWNVLGWPGVNVPAGLTDDGLPVGAQLLGPAGTERTLVSLAAQLETVEKWADLRPPGSAGAGG
ncbi:MAG TPA: amidase [Pseudonocardiaceae bacterium]|nr:amidase [Pseudonocardiaceae bacterium]